MPGIDLLERNMRVLQQSLQTGFIFGGKNSGCARQKRHTPNQ